METNKSLTALLEIYHFYVKIIMLPTYLNMLDAQTTLSDLEERQYKTLKSKLDELTEKKISPPNA